MVIKVVDVFAGPGGLNEGFASYLRSGRSPFFIALSIEKEQVACDTLALRAALRLVEADRGSLPAEYSAAARAANYLSSLESSAAFASALDSARRHVVPFTLDESTRDDSDTLIRRAVSGSDPWVLVGGPPCQLYSLVGRARASRLPGFEDDVRHVLYKEYLHILERHQPDVFVMENVKGMLSAIHRDGQVFERIQADISKAGYELRSLVVDGVQLEPSDFVIRANLYGVPQKRHRVILLGVRNDLASLPTGTLKQSEGVTVRSAMGHLPPIRSRLSPSSRDAFDSWLEARDYGLKLARRDEPFGAATGSIGGRFIDSDDLVGDRTGYDSFVRRPELGGVAQHEARSHMSMDISRYAFYSQKMVGGEKWNVNDLPAPLLPHHRNVGRADTPFVDRFRVQAWDDQSTTVVSHISKDGHYFIHPDPLQARSLTVREAARLQSFPDDYLFCGNRTEQYHQVGNAVPPFLAAQIAEVVHDLFV